MLAFFICCAIGLTMSFMGGYVIDTVHEKMLDAPGSDSDFAQQSEGMVYFFINTYYLLTYAIPALGAIIFGQSIIKRVRQSDFVYR